MTHPLASLREYLLSHENPGRLLEIADGYLSSFAKMGDNFILPAAHATLKPVLEYYAGDAHGWLKYVRSIRDALDKRDARWPAVYALFRTLDIRTTQQDRRDRLNAAVAAAVERKLIADTVEDKRRYANRCTQAWIRQRTMLLDAVRRDSARGRVSEAERSELLEKFWDEVDQRIAAGEVPEP